MAEHDDIDRASGAVHRRDLARIIRLVVIVALVAAFIAVALDNRADVRVGYVIDEALAPGWLVILLSAIGGLVIGWMMRLRSRNRDRPVEQPATQSPTAAGLRAWPRLCTFMGERGALPATRRASSGSVPADETPASA